MKVLLVCYDFSRAGGCERVALNLYNELSNTLDIKIISLYKANTSCSLCDDNIDYLKPGEGSFVRDFITTTLALRKKAKLFSPEIIISIGVNASLYVVTVARILKVKSVICEHSNLSNVYYNTRNQMIKRNIAIPLCTRFVTLTEEDSKEYAIRYPRYKNKFTHIYNWIEINSVQMNHVYNSSAHKIITICRIDRVKGIETSIDIFKRVQNEFPDWIWEIYGDGDQQYLKELTEKLQLDNISRFYFKGFIKDPKSIYKDAAIYACTSIYEGLPVSLLEAKSWHVPIISFRCKTGPSEIILDNINGYLIDEGNVNDYVKKLRQLMDNESVRKQFSENSYLNIDNFSIKSIVKKWTELFKAVLKD